MTAKAISTTSGEARSASIEQPIPIQRSGPTAQSREMPITTPRSASAPVPASVLATPSLLPRAIVEAIPLGFAPAKELPTPTLGTRAITSTTPHTYSPAIEPSLPNQPARATTTTMTTVCSPAKEGPKPKRPPRAIDKPNPNDPAPAHV